MENKAVIIDATRSPIGIKNGEMVGIRPDDLAAQVVKGLMERNNTVTSDQVEDLVMGCAFPEGPQGMLIGRSVVALAGLPQTVPAKVVNRFCGSAMDALHQVSTAIESGDIEVGIAAGIEDMFSIPPGGFAPDFHPELAEQEYYIGMGETAENLANDGNITDSFIPSIIGLPNDWQVYYSHTNGITLNPQTGVTLYPGESKQIDLKIMPSINESTGFTQMTFKAYSAYYNEVNTTLPVQFQVLADRIPLITEPEQRPSCPPGNTCTFSALVENIGAATDVFDLSIDQTSLASGWQVGLEWTQASSILVRPDTPVVIFMTMTLPNNCAPDTISSFKLTATSQNDSRRFHEIEIDISASMISNASVEATTTQKL